jgi:hypothetical protein
MNYRLQMDTVKVQGGGQKGPAVQPVKKHLVAVLDDHLGQWYRTEGAEGKANQRDLSHETSQKVVEAREKDGTAARKSSTSSPRFNP